MFIHEPLALNVHPVLMVRERPAHREGDTHVLRGRQPIGCACTQRECPWQVCAQWVCVCMEKEMRTRSWGRQTTGCACGWGVCVHRGVCARVCARTPGGHTHTGGRVWRDTGRTYSSRRLWLSSWEGGIRQQLNVMTRLPKRSSPAGADTGVRPTRTRGLLLQGHPQALMEKGSLLSSRPELRSPGGWQAAPKEHLLRMLCAH